MRAPGPMGILLALCVVCSAGALFSLYLFKGASQVTGPATAPITTGKIAGSTDSQNKISSVSAPSKPSEPATETPATDSPLHASIEPFSVSAAPAEEDPLPRDPISRRSGAMLRVVDCKVEPGAEIEINVLFRTGRPVSSIRFLVEYPKEVLLVRRIAGSPKGYGEAEGANEALGRTKVRFDFKNPFRAYGEVPLVILKTVVAGSSRTGETFPIRIASAMAFDPEGQEFPVEVQDGKLILSDERGGGIATMEIASSPEEDPWFVAQSSDRSEGPPTSNPQPSEIETAEVNPTEAPPLEPEPTPANAENLERLLWLSNAAGVPGENFAISLNIDNSWDVRGIHFQLNFDSSSLRFLGAEPGPLFGRFWVMDHAVGPTVQVAMLGEAPLGEYRNARVCDLYFSVSSTNVAKSQEPMRLRGAHVISEEGSFRAVARSGWVTIAPPAPESGLIGEEKSALPIRVGSNKSEVSGAPKQEAITRRMSPDKDPKTPVLAPIDRADLNFDGTVDAIDLAILLEFFHGE